MDLEVYKRAYAAGESEREAKVTSLFSSSIPQFFNSLLSTPWSRFGRISAYGPRALLLPRMLLGKRLRTAAETKF
jgi:hypothetical protein